MCFALGAALVHFVQVVLVTVANNKQFHFTTPNCCFDAGFQPCQHGHGTSFAIFRSMCTRRRALRQSYSLCGACAGDFVAGNTGLAAVLCCVV